MVGQLQDARTRVRARVVTTVDTVPSLRMVFGADLLAVEPAGGEAVEVVVGAARVEMLGWTLAGWGARLEVLEPVELRRELARIGARLQGSYASDSPDPASRT